MQGDRRWEEESGVHRKQRVASPWFNRHLQIWLGILLFQPCCGTREASRILLRGNRGKVGREIGSGRHTVFSIVKSSISHVESVKLIKSKPGKVLRNAGTRPSGKGMREMVT